MEKKTDYVTDNPYLAGKVKRYHTWPTIQTQTVGEHCWAVALVYEQIFGPLSTDVERYIRHHDTAELVVGDPPFPVKAEDEGLKAGYDRLEPLALAKMDVAQLPELSETERTKVKICDLLEMMVLGMTEREMGNLLAAPIVIRTERAALARLDSALLVSVSEVRAVREWIARQWDRHEAVLRMADVSHRYNRAGRSTL